MTNHQVVVSPEWLNQHLNNPQVVVVDCRFSLAQTHLGREKYQASHIPGAYYLDLNQDLSGPVEKHGGRHPLPNPIDLANKLSAMGVEFQKTLVVAYDDFRFAFAARLWWLLRYLGHDKVALLDGGFSSWDKAGYPVTDIVPVSSVAAFVPQIKAQMLVDISDVKDRRDRPGTILVDAREGDRYRGEREPIDPIAGHIPGAVNYPWTEVTHADGFVLPPAEQSQRWQKIADAEEILVYCGSGVTACVDLLSLELADIHTGKLYVGSWSDWISYN